MCRFVAVNCIKWNDEGLKGFIVYAISPFLFFRIEIFAKHNIMYFVKKEKKDVVFLLK